MKLSYSTISFILKHLQSKIKHWVKKQTQTSKPTKQTPLPLKHKNLLQKAKQRHKYTKILQEKMHSYKRELRLTFITMT